MPGTGATVYPRSLTGQRHFAPLLVPLTNGAKSASPNCAARLMVDRSRRSRTLPEWFQGGLPFHDRGAPAHCRVVAIKPADAFPSSPSAAEANVKRRSPLVRHTHVWARAVAIAPFYYKLTPESVYALLRRNARHRRSTHLYNIPMFASPIDVPTVRRLAADSRVIGIKDSSGDLAS